MSRKELSREEAGLAARLEIQSDGGIAKIKDRMSQLEAAAQAVRAEAAQARKEAAQAVAAQQAAVAMVEILSTLPTRGGNRDGKAEKPNTINLNTLKAGPSTPDDGTLDEINVQLYARTALTSKRSFRHPPWRMKGNWARSVAAAPPPPRT